MTTPERISKKGYLYHKRVSDRGKPKEDSWKLYYCVLHGLTLRFYRDQEAENDTAYTLIPPASVAEPQQLQKAGFLDVTRCLLAIDYKTQSAAAATNLPGERKHIFSLTCQDMSEFRLQAANESAVLTWVAKIQSNLEHCQSTHSSHGDEDGDGEGRDQLDSLDSMIKNRVTSEIKNKRQSLRTRNVLSLVRSPTRRDQSSLSEISETLSDSSKSSTLKSSPKKTPSSASINSTSAEDADADEAPIKLPDQRLVCLHEQLHARQKLLEQLEEEENQFLARQAGKTVSNNRTLSACVEEAASFERCLFTTNIRQEYYLVPGYLSSAVSAGEEVTVFGRARNGRWRCHFHRPGIAILRCAASGQPGYDIKASRNDPDSSQKSSSEPTANPQGPATEVKTMRPQRSAGVLTPSLLGSIKKAPEPAPESPSKDASNSGSKERQPVEITTSATTKEYPMIGCVPASLLLGLGDAQHLVDEVEKWQATQESGSQAPVIARGISTESCSGEPQTEKLLQRISETSGSGPSSDSSSHSVQLNAVLPSPRMSDCSVASNLSTTVRQISIPGAVRQLGLEIRIGEQESSDEGSDVEDVTEDAANAVMPNNSDQIAPTGSMEMEAAVNENGSFQNQKFDFGSVSVSAASSLPNSGPNTPGMNTPVNELESDEADESFDMCSPLPVTSMPVSASAPPRGNHMLEDDAFAPGTQSLPLMKSKSGTQKKKVRSQSVADEPKEPRLLSRVTNFFSSGRRESFDLASLSPASARRKSSTASVKSDRRGSAPNTAVLSVDGPGGRDSPALLAPVGRKASAMSTTSATSTVSTATTVRPPLNELRTVRLVGFQSKSPGLSLDTYELSVPDDIEADNEDEEELSASGHQVFIASIEDRSCAEKAGMAVGDAILQVEASSTTGLSPDEVMELFASKSDNVSVKIKFTDGVRRRDCQARLKDLKAKLAAKEKSLRAVDTCQEDVQSGGANLVAVRKKLNSCDRQLQFRDTPKRSMTKSFRRSMSTAGRTLTAALWGTSLAEEGETRLRSASISHALAKSKIIEAEESESSDDDVITEEATL